MNEVSEEVTKLVSEWESEVLLSGSPKQIAWAKFQKNCAEEYLMQMPAEELEAWKTLAKIDCHYKIQVWCGYRRETTITSDFVIDDTAVNLIREREWVEETRKHRVAHYFHCYKRI